MSAQIKDGGKPSWVEVIAIAVPEWNKALAERSMQLAELPRDRVEAYMIAYVDPASLYTPDVFDPLFGIVYEDGACTPDAPYMSSKDVFQLVPKRDELRANFPQCSYEIIPVTALKAGAPS